MNDYGLGMIVFKSLQMLYPELLYIISIFASIKNAVILTKTALLLWPVTTVVDYNNNDSDSSDVLIKKMLPTIMNAASVIF